VLVEVTAVGCPGVPSIEEREKFGDQVDEHASR
jgi:hypothetical protein